MGISVICTGTELLRGSTVNSNLAALGKALTARGMRIDAEFSVGDREAELSGAIAAALKISDTLVITGGLGPTADDLTLVAAARFFGLDTHCDPDLVRKVESFWGRLHQGRCPKSQYKQALLPNGGRAIPNPHGSASGIEFESTYANRIRHVFLLPGPPTEFEPMVRDYLAQRLCELSPERDFVRGFLAAGVGESLASRLAERALGGADPALAYTAGFEGTRIYIGGENGEEVEGKLRMVRAEFGAAALPEGEFALSPYLLKELSQRKLTLSVAESCTGGMIASGIVDVPGSSAVFLGGVVAYDNAVKREVLGVPPEVLEQFGAVSGETAEAMARGVAARLGSSCSIATTGVAGPGGGTAEKPVGLVYVAAVVGGRCEVREFHFRGERGVIRSRAAAKGLLLAVEMLRNDQAC